MNILEITDIHHFMAGMLCERKRAIGIHENTRNGRGEAGSKYGSYGEVMALQWLDDNGVSYEFTDTIGYDLLIEGRKVEIKTKQRAAQPKPEYSVCVRDYTRDIQKVDWYIHVCVYPKPDFKTAAIVGWHTPAMMQKHGSQRTPDHVGKNGTSPDANTMNMQIKDCISPDNMLKKIK